MSKKRMLTIILTSAVIIAIALSTRNFNYDVYRAETDRFIVSYTEKRLESSNNEKTIRESLDIESKLGLDELAGTTVTYFIKRGDTEVNGERDFSDSEVEIKPDIDDNIVTVFSPRDATYPKEAIPDIHVKIKADDWEETIFLNFV